ncbi:2-amino-4-hydroxy-6-hydroxymethyldihydropteridine diphosphokinase [Parvibaculum indicum]|uniref:2-amino-4-hydroxy-6- hydroxymethyldihydropteridine diphosphokinase n=1 Tax=Parvibaculum indicum TaxID=562969 RepID=UPI00142070A5|nr:2-amino-4-hydroxy-6-hydroxymethyldihydropteridine diphosphokinase [Parvibaculum indicum]NIJ40000.1 2-amino-4-hydroxy-6-hydroxymethyldihydropteridine diphosphokinase [Parvibaculum indicum]
MNKPSSPGARDEPVILIALGGNLPTEYGSPRRTLEAALREMDGRGIRVVAVSRFYRTPPVSPHEQPDFVNAVAQVETDRAPEALLAELHEIERHFGRERRLRWFERTLDLDLLDYRGQVVAAEGERGVEAGTGPLPLALPHPGIAERGFVLVPLKDVVPGWRHPVTGKNVDALIGALPPDALRRIEPLKP